MTILSLQSAVFIKKNYLCRNTVANCKFQTVTNWCHICFSGKCLYYNYKLTSKFTVHFNFFIFFSVFQSNKHPKEFAESLKTEAPCYNGFNLIVADVTSKSMVYISNRPKGQPITIQEVPPGLHVLTNAKLDSPWHKVG